jgi:hypothetical protein
VGIGRVRRTIERGRPVLLLCVGSVVALAACGGAEVSGSTPQGSISPTASPSRITPSYARADLERELATAPVLPGAIETSRSPTPALDDTPQRDLRVDLNRWWTAPGSVAHALEYLKAHPPSGAEVDGTGTRTQPGQLSVYSIVYGHAAEALPMLEIDVTAYRDGVAVHANVQDSGFSS